MADDDRAVMERLAALEAEVKADADAQRARKAAALAKLRDQRVTQTSERERHHTQMATQKATQRGARQAELVSKHRRVGPAPSELDDVDVDDEPGERSRHTDPVVRGDDDASHLENLSGALELASKANRVKQELQRAPGKGEKSWIISGVASLALGPIGWLYAGSLREAVPATTGWLLLAAIASKLLPVFLMMPALMVVLPLSGIAGVVYALQYNRKGSRQRLFDDDKEPKKQLRSG